MCKTNTFCYKALTTINTRRYEVLMFSFLLLLFGDTFADTNKLQVAGIYQNLLFGLIIFDQKKWIRYTVIGVLLLAVTIDFYSAFIPMPAIKSRLGLFYLLFFFLVANEGYKEVLCVKTVTREMLAAALCGFVLLCLIAISLFLTIEVERPGSFINVGQKREVLANINYFSFTTLLTIGFGNITPVMIIAKRAVMLMGLTGQFYTVFITSIIIGKTLYSK